MSPGPTAGTLDLTLPFGNWLLYGSAFLPQWAGAAGDVIPLGTLGEIVITITGPEIVLAGVTLIAAAAIWQAIERGREGNMADSGVEVQMWDVMSKNRGMDPCSALAVLAQQASGNPQQLKKVRRTEKAYGCRNIQGRQ